MYAYILHSLYADTSAVPVQRNIYLMTTLQFCRLQKALAYAGVATVPCPPQV